MSTNVFSGARAIFKINGASVAYASGCNGSEEVLYEPVDVLDQVETAEYVPVGYRVSFNCSIFRTIPGVGASVTGTGKPSPDKSNGGKLGSLKAVGIFPKIANILTNGIMDATITDRLTGTTIMKLDEVKAATMNFNVTARGIVGQDVSFNAIRLRDESE